MIRHPQQRPVPTLVRAFALLAMFMLFVSSRVALGNGADLPPEVLLQGYAKTEDGRLRLLIRIPLVLLSSFPLPKRGPGYLDLSRIDDALRQAGVATGNQIEFSQGGVRLTPMVRATRLSLLADRSFASYAAALAHFDAPPLPADTELFWNQGFFDAELDYPLRSADAPLTIRMNVAPELGRRVKLRLEVMTAGRPVRRYDLPGNLGAIPLDPRWHESAWLSVQSGFASALALDRFVFLLCLIAPFRQLRGPLAVAVVYAGLQALTATAVADGAVVASPWLPALYGAVLAAAVVLLAIGNLAAPSLRRRWFVAALVGALGGFGMGRLMGDLQQFAGDHELVSFAAAIAGMTLGSLVIVAGAFVAFRVVFARVLGPPLGVFVLSAVLGHEAWHWLEDAGPLLRHAAEGGLPAPFVASLGLWLLPALLVGGIAWFLPKTFGGAPVPSLFDSRRRSNG